jgi:hypothetical protein
MLCSRLHQIIGFFSGNGRIFVGRIGNVFDRHEERHVGSNAHHPTGNTLTRGDILTIEIEGQFRGAGVVKETVVIFDELQKRKNTKN